jgi:MurNAc alpha-1-phosphate uridylyltransferase
MEAMIFAAGLGTRLKPLTDRIPKALAPVAGRPLLGRVMDRLVSAGVTRIVVNTSVHGDQVAEWLKANATVDYALSPEPDGPYDTGGGLAAATHLFHGDGPIILHNVDVLSAIPLEAMVAAHRGIATLAVQDRATSRKIQFDDAGLVGWGSLRAREARGVVREWAFSGIHVIDRKLLSGIDRRGVFPIRDVYLALAAQDAVIHTYESTPYEWLDVGTPERLARANELMTGE